MTAVAVESRRPPSRLGSRTATSLTHLAALVTVFGAWQLASIGAGGAVLPGPLDAAPVFARLLLSGDFIGPLWGSLARAGSAFVFAFLLGAAYGLAAGRSPSFEHVTRYVFQFALFANTLVLILWGLAILGHTNAIAVVVIGALAVFPTVGVYMRETIKAADADLVDMARAYRVGRRQRAIQIYLPFLAPAMLSIARIAFSQSWKVVMLAEVFGFPGGIGWEIRQAYTAYNLSAVIAWLAFFIIALLVVEQLIRFIDRRVITWRES